MIKILFVCHGNICRSPMAEFIMKDLVKKKGLEDKFEIASCATSNEEAGNTVYTKAKRKLLEHGISCEGKTARKMTTNDYKYYDYIIAMERFNIRNMMRITGEDTERKISLLMEFTDSPKDVEDPWYTDDFERAYNDIKKGCEGLLKETERYL